MKKIVGSLSIAFLFLSTVCAQEKNADSLFYKVFDAIKNNDAASYIKLFVNYKQYQSLIMESAANSTDSAFFMQIALRYTQNDFEEQVIKSEEVAFRKFIGQLTLKRIDPAGLHFTGSQYEEKKAPMFKDQILVSGNIS